MKHYSDYRVVCPYYSMEEHSKIHCDGICEGSSTHLWFAQKEIKKAHKKKYCLKMDNYINCPIYSAISQQYKEDEEEDDE